VPYCSATISLCITTFFGRYVAEGVERPIWSVRRVVGFRRKRTFFHSPGSRRTVNYVTDPQFAP
jgi:hypothetical protein